MSHSANQHETNCVQISNSDLPLHPPARTEILRTFPSLNC